MFYVKLAEHKQEDGKTDRLLVFDGTGIDGRNIILENKQRKGRESNWKGSPSKSPS